MGRAQAVLFGLVGALPFFLLGATAALNRLGRRRDPAFSGHTSPFTAMAWAAGLGGTAFLLAAGGPWPERFCGLAYFLVVTGLAGFVHWFVFTITDVSMHVRLLTVLGEEGPLTPAELRARYNRRVIISNRVARLLELGQLSLRDGRYFLAGAGVLTGARVCTAMRWILGIPLVPPPR